MDYWKKSGAKLSLLFLLLRYSSSSRTSPCSCFSYVICLPGNLVVAASKDVKYGHLATETFSFSAGLLTQCCTFIVNYYQTYRWNSNMLDIFESPKMLLSNSHLKLHLKLSNLHLKLSLLVSGCK